MTTGQTDGAPPEADALDHDVFDASADADGVASVGELQAEIDSLRQQHLRAVADYQNLRRRSEEERREYARYTLAALVINYLPVLDDLDRALESVDADIAGHRWVEGVQMVERKFRAVLEASGVKPIEAVGQTFDPAQHEAISYAPGPDGQVVGVAQPGYMLDERVIRPARVVVGNGTGMPSV